MVGATATVPCTSPYGRQWSGELARYDRGLDAVSAERNLTAPLGGVECATRVPLGGVEWHEILRQLGILQSLRHSVASSARRARHSVASSGALEKMLARSDNVDTAGPKLPLLQIGLRTLGLAAHRHTRPYPNPATSAHMRRAHAPAAPCPGFRRRTCVGHNRHPYVTCPVR